MFVTGGFIHYGTLTPDGKFLVGRSIRQGTLFVDPTTGQTVRALGREASANEPLPEVVAVSADGSRAVAVPSRLGASAISVLDTQTGLAVVRVERDAPAGPDGVAISADGKRLVIGQERKPFGKDAAEGTTSVVVWGVAADKQLVRVTPAQRPASRRTARACVRSALDAPRTRRTSPSRRAGN